MRKRAVAVQQAQRGRRAVDGAVGVERATVTLMQHHRRALKVIGGSAFLRRQIDIEIARQKRRGVDVLAVPKGRRRQAGS